MIPHEALISVLKARKEFCEADPYLPRGTRRYAGHCYGWTLVEGTHEDGSTDFRGRPGTYKVWCLWGCGYEEIRTITEEDMRDVVMTC